ncbi:MAG: reverse transcriptase/maturase family protein [Trichlorobacter sp.]|nr:reverse transcriptase/maturase family protein [Trichlorobacter sp.]
MNNGNVNNNNKNNNNYVWPVRVGEWSCCTPDAPVNLPAFDILQVELFSSLYKSYLRCRRLKRNTINALDFEYRAELNLLDLSTELLNGNYSPSRAIRFAVDKPKLREIVAADFRDRVVHHYLVEHLEKIFEPIFIHDSYACRTGKGVHKALLRAKEFIRKGTRNGRVPLYSLHLDVKNFFITINKRILADLIEDKLVKQAQKQIAVSRQNSKSLSPEKKNCVKTLPLSFLNYLARIVIAHNPMHNRIDKGDPHILAAVPPHKSLLYASPGVGLPIGNLTSQFFANVYLNELDQYCKHTLKCRWYIRYCDDFLILDNNPQQLAFIREKVRCFLRKQLRLELNTRYASIKPVTSGIDFVGYIIRPDYTLVRRRSVNNFKCRLEKFQHNHVSKDTEGLLKIKATKEELQHLRGIVASYCGHFKWGDTRRLRKSIFYRYPWLNAMYSLNRQTMPVKRDFFFNI